MNIKRSKFFWMATGALVVCSVACMVGLLRQREPRYGGHSLSYWLDRLEPTVISPAQELRHWPPEKFRNPGALAAWIALTSDLHLRSAQVLSNAGPECLPVLLARLTTKQTQFQMRFLREFAYAVRLTDRGPFPGTDYGEVRRGQALTAILLLDKRAAPLVPKLAGLAAEDSDDSVHRAASYALHSIAPEEFRRVRAPVRTLP